MISKWRHTHGGINHIDGAKINKYTLATESMINRNIVLNRMTHHLGTL